MSNPFADRRLYVIFSITLIAVTGVASLTPAFPKIAKALHLDKAHVGLLISVFTLPGIFLAPVAGVLADRYGRKTVLVPSLFLFALAGFACFFTRTFHLLLIFRFFQGIGAASLGSLNVTLIGDYYKGKDRAGVMGYNASFLSLSTATYPLIGGLLAGIGWYYPFLLPLLAIPVGLFVIFGLEEPEFHRNPHFFEYLKKAGKSLLRKEVIGVFALSVLTFIILFGAFLTYLPFLLSENFHFTPQKIGIFLSLSSFSTALVATLSGRLTAKFGSTGMLKIAFLLYTVVALSVPNIHSWYWMVLPVILFGTAQALNIPSLQTMLANLAPDEQRAIFMSTNGMVLRLGQTLGPPVIGIGYVLGNIEGVYYLAALISLLGLGIIFTMLNQQAVIRIV